MLRLIKKSGTIDKAEYKAIDTDHTGRAGYFRIIPRGATVAKWYRRGGIEDMLEELDGGGLVLFFHDEKVSLKGSVLTQVPLALATGICLTLRAFNPDIHAMPASGEPVITEIVRIATESPER
jgi:hypothetical protein